MNRQLLEYVYELFPNPKTVKLKFLRSGDDLSLVLHQNIALLFFHYKGKSVNIIDESILEHLEKVGLIFSPCSNLIRNYFHHL